MQVRQVEVFAWNPRRCARLPARIDRYGLVGTRPNNFGDLLGPIIVARLLARAGLRQRFGRRRQTLLSVGSVLHFAHDGDVIWGTGLNGKVPAQLHQFSNLDVRAVRGPLTRSFLEARGVRCPGVFGDPALLLPELMPDLVKASKSKRFSLTVVPNLNDIGSWATGPDVLDPRTPVLDCLTRIVQSEFVVGSSLHGIVVAEAFGVPARGIASATEDPTKYEDYFQGTGRVGVQLASSVAEATKLEPQPPPSVDLGSLLDAFPADLWVKT
jgi:pyruvyltransferase